MALTAGTRLGRYEIVAPLGAGGMGEVYRARDTTLNRDVALKVLPDAFTADPDRRARFTREAQVLASLNHPNIAHVHGLEEAGSTSALVMELVEGPTLAELLEERRALPVDDVLPIARQMADALEAAHELGIVHRDLKPANVKVRPDGTVKVLDFGLAKALNPDVAATSASAMNSPTLTAHATALGIILGTAAYMAPEQAKGKPVDRRADIWAFGLVVYELLTGRRGYDAEDVSETLAGVLTRDVDWTALPANMPPGLIALLRDCLVRDPKQRLRDIGDARRVLDRILAGGPDAHAAATVPSSARSATARALPWTLAVLALTGVAALAGVHFSETPPSRQTIRFRVSSPDTSPIASFALSPDGRSLAIATGDLYTGVLGATSKLWLRSIDSLDARLVHGTEGTGNLPDQFFWSPDGEAIAFVTQDGKLLKVSGHGGPPQALEATVAPISKGSWGSDGVIVYTANPGVPIQRIPATGGRPVDVTKRGDGLFRFQPQFLPDGRHILYYVAGAGAQIDGIYTSSLDEGAPAARLLPDRSVARFVAAGGRGGYLLFLRAATLMAQPFDADTRTLSGEPLPIAESVGRFSVSGDALAYMSGSPMSPMELQWVDRTGRQLGVAAPAAEYRYVRLSPDEKTISFDRSKDDNTDVWTLDLKRGVPSRLTTDLLTDRLAIWSHDGRRILWSRRGGETNTMDLYINAATGTGEAERFLPLGTGYGSASDWSRDGRFILFQRPGQKTGQDLWILPHDPGAAGEARKPFPYLAEAANEGWGAFSPDGRWIAYESDETGKTEVYVQAFPRTRQKVQISNGGGTDAAWSNSGELFYRATDGKLIAVRYRATQTTFEAGEAKVLFPLKGTLAHRSFAATADGSRFLVGKPVDDAVSEPITVVVNWLEDLKKRSR